MRSELNSRNKFRSVNAYCLPVVRYAAGIVSSLCTRDVQHVYSQSSNPKCRLFGAQAETVGHLISGCSQLAGTQYLMPHNNVAKSIHWMLCGKYDIQREHSCGSIVPIVLLRMNV